MHGCTDGCRRTIPNHPVTFSEQLRRLLFAKVIKCACRIVLGWMHEMLTMRTYTLSPRPSKTTIPANYNIHRLNAVYFGRVNIADCRRKTGTLLARATQVAMTCRLPQAASILHRRGASNIYNYRYQRNLGAVEGLRCVTAWHRHQL
jgi:hypothetical protein